MESTDQTTAAARLLRLGQQALHGRGDLATARACFETAYEHAETADDPDGLAAAALGLGGLWVHEHRPAADAARVEVRQWAALARLEPGHPLALRLRARLAAEADYRANRSTSIMTILAEARRLGDPVAIVECLSLAHHCVLGPDDASTRLTLAEEMLRVATRSPRPGDLIIALLWRAVDLFLIADPHAERALAELCARLDRQPHAAAEFVVSGLHVMRAIRAGRLAEAESLAADCARRGRQVGDADAIGWHGAQLATIRWYQGRLAELVPHLTDVVNGPHLSVADDAFLPALAVAAAQAGDRRQAEAVIARLRGRGLASLPRSASWLVSLSGTVEAANALGDADLAAEAYDLLRPFEGLPMMASLGISCLGSVHHALGVAALTMGRADVAVEHLRAAVRDNQALGHQPAATLSRHRLGEALHRRGGRGDVAAAEVGSAAARREATALGMRLPRITAGPVPPSCSRQGRNWRIDIGGRAATVADSVGMRYLAVLLANPGQEIPAIDLAGVAGWHAGSAVAGRPTMSAQPVLDDVALREFRQRLTRLRGEIDAAEARGDHAAADRLHTESEWLTAELAKATGLRARPRRFADDTERARIAVGKAIRRSLGHIEAANPVLGAELRASVQTGLRCCYRPESSWPGTRRSYAAANG